jgi:hypothetical protein
LRHVNAKSRLAIILQLHIRWRLEMDMKKLRLSHAVAGAVALLAVTVPVLADDDDAWFGGKDTMGQWFRGEMIGRNMMDGWGPGMM